MCRYIEILVLISRLQSDCVIHVSRGFKYPCHHAVMIAYKLLLTLSVTDHAKESWDDALLVVLHLSFSNFSNPAQLLSEHSNAVTYAESSPHCFRLSLSCFVFWLACNEGITRIIREAAAALSLSGYFS